MFINSLFGWPRSLTKTDSPEISRWMTHVGPNPFRGMKTECSALFRCLLTLYFSLTVWLQSPAVLIARDTSPPIKFCLQKSPLPTTVPFSLMPSHCSSLNCPIKASSPFQWGCSYSAPQPNISYWE